MRLFFQLVYPLNNLQNNELHTAHTGGRRDRQRRSLCGAEVVSRGADQIGKNKGSL